jgi:hypothetical protein
MRRNRERSLLRYVPPRHVLLVLFSALPLLGCSDNESESWVSVRIGRCVDTQGFDAPCGPGKFLTDSQVSPDLRRRSIEPRETVCGVEEANFNPFTITSGGPPDRIYHFRVSGEEAQALIATGLYMDRSEYESMRQPFTAVPCGLYGFGR